MLKEIFVLVRAPCRRMKEQCIQQYWLVARAIMLVKQLVSLIIVCNQPEICICTCIAYNCSRRALILNCNFMLCGLEHQTRISGGIGQPGSISTFYSVNCNFMLCGLEHQTRISGGIGQPGSISTFYSVTTIGRNRHTRLVHIILSRE